MKLTRGERFKDARIMYNKNGKQTMAEVYNSTGVPASLIKDLEDDDKNRSVGYDKVAILAEYYGVPSDYLLGLTDDPSRKPCAVDDLGLSLKVIEWLKYVKDYSSDKRNYIGAYSDILSTFSFRNLMSAIYDFMQARIADEIYFTTKKEFFDQFDPLQIIEHEQEFFNIIFEKAKSGKYNPDVSNILFQIAKTETMVDDQKDDNFWFSSSINGSIIYHHYKSLTSEMLEQLLNELAMQEKKELLKNGLHRKK